MRHGAGAHRHEVWPLCHRGTLVLNDVGRSSDMNFHRGGGYTVVFVPKQNSTVWNFQWTAPPAGTGPVTIFYGVVEGDKGG